MKNVISGLVLALSLITGGGKMVDKVLENIVWLGHASFVIKGDKTIYIDPWKIKGDLPKADIVLITHDHFDHCSPGDVRKVSTDSTVILATPGCASKLGKNARSVKPGESMEISGVKIETVPAYNIGKSFHPKASGFVGYIVTVQGVRIYHAGDTDLIPEMKEIKADIALLPVGGTYTMNAEEAAKAADIIAPEIAIPMHWGDIVGDRSDAETFKKLVKKAKVIILTPNR